MGEALIGEEAGMEERAWTPDPALHPAGVTDFHAHLPGERLLPPPGHPLLEEYERQRDHRKAIEWGMAPVKGLAPLDRTEALAEFWVQEMERYGLRWLVFVTGGGNDRLAELVTRHPDRFVGFAHHPLVPGAEVELKRAVEELSLKGYKILAPLTQFPFEDVRLRPVWEFCAERQLPIVIHFGFLGRGGGVVAHPRINPLTLYPVARAFPEIPFVIPHFGAGYFREVLALCWSLPNIYIDTSGSNQWARWMPYPLTLEDLFRKAYETVGPERIIFGSDSHSMSQGFLVRYLQEQLKVCRQLNLKDIDIYQIFSGNGARLLGIEPLVAKGTSLHASLEGGGAL